MKFLKIIGNIITFILSILFFLFIVSFSSLLFLKHTLETENIEKYIEKIDIFSLPAKDIFNDTYNDNKQLKDVIAEKLEKNNINKDLTFNILESKELNIFLSDFTKEYLNYLLFNEAKPIITENELKLVINENKLEQSLNRPLNPNEKQKLNNFIKDILPTLNEEIPDKEINIFDNKTISILKIINNENFVIYGTITILLFFLLMALFSWSLYKPFLAMGIPSSILGLILTSTYFLQKIIISRLIETQGAVETIIVKGIDVLFFDMLYLGLIAFTIGIVMIIIYKILKKIFYVEDNDDLNYIPRKKESIESKKLK